jgi:LacI family transcriptional regulator
MHIGIHRRNFRCRVARKRFLSLDDIVADTNPVATLNTGKSGRRDDRRVSSMAKSLQSRSPTIADVAARAGVSLATVSRVMNGRTTVDPSLAARVRDAAQALNYSASPLARSLVLGKTQTVAVVVPDLANPTFQGALHGISMGASHDGYHVLVADSSESVGEEQLLAIAARRRCDGIVLVAPRMPRQRLIELLPAISPVVLINRDPESTKVPFVSADYGAGLAELLRHVHGLGHTHIAFLSGSAQSASNASRLLALHAFAHENPKLRVEVITCGVNIEDGHGAAERVITSGATAVLAFNDLVAIGLLSALTERGIRVPDQISIAGFDDIPFARYTAPTLTTASVPVEQLGEQAWSRLRDLLGGAVAAEGVSYIPHLTIRGSTGPAPQK